MLILHISQVAESVLTSCGYISTMWLYPLAAVICRNGPLPVAQPALHTAREAGELASYGYVIAHHVVISTECGYLPEPSSACWTACLTHSERSSSTWSVSHSGSMSNSCATNKQMECGYIINVVISFKYYQLRY